ncbi:MAG: hypothetical protein R3240_05650, partial [Gammaproteobacteria bacterium]|nr:hypothetical protein [Gammaproteobacteria bacterium]
MSRKFWVNALALSMSAVAIDATAAYSSATPKIYGNVGFHYTGSRNKEGATSNSAYTTLSANAQSFLWRPWFATYNLGATASMLQSDSGATSTSTNLIYSHLDFSLLPRSRFPFRFSMNYGNDVESWGLGSLDWLDVGDKQTLYMNARQSYITRKGDRVDGWVTQRTRNYYDAELKDTTYGAKIKTRGKHQNLYANASYQTRSNSLTDLETTNVIAALTHNYFPTSEFYIKSLVSTTHYEDNALIDHTSTFNDRVTDRNQVSTFMYWRPQYRPYTATAGLRAYRRGNSLTDLSGSNQVGFDANAAANYTINRRLIFTASANTSIIHTRVDADNKTDSQSANISALLNYRSDRIMLRDFVYSWYVNGGVGNQMSVHFQEFDAVQNLSVGAGHSAYRVWVTGNRSTLRINLTQSAREFAKYDPLDTGLN